MTKTAKKTTKKQGRNTFYTTEILEDLISEYLDANPYTVKLIPNKIAKFAREKRGEAFKNIRYSQFTQNKDVKDKIDKFNEKHREISVPSKNSPTKVARLNTDALVDAYHGDIKELKSSLRQFAVMYENMRKERLDYIEKIETLKNEVDTLKQQVLELETEKVELKKVKAEQNKTIRENAKKVAHANRVEKFIRSIDVYEDLLKQKLAKSMDEENLRLLLSNAGLLKQEEMVDTTKYLNGLVYESELYEEDDIEHDIDNQFYDMDDEDFLSVFENNED